MNKGSKTRSGLLWEIERILEDMKMNWKTSEMPKYLLLENVETIRNKKNINSLNSWINKLEHLGYETKMYYLNSSNFNSCQNRVRAYGLSVRKDWKTKVNFNFPNLENIIQKNKLGIKKILEKNVESKYFLNNLEKYKRTPFRLTKNNIYKSQLIGYTKFSAETFIYDLNYTGPALTASGAQSRIKILENNHIRKLTPLECFKYMAFDKKDYQKVHQLNLGDEKEIFLAGNSIVVSVLESIFKELKF